ncbi:Os11g0201540 [Oryza sativa Japonica Group]|uniref:Os11g0201540 protein n=1 Tax=Oryza sativa subsp. japonica TaxID=39947 RepID=A0A0P0XZR0_ORYSJ|nr:Os11g0201540 [Oryza sativa Japonica Group]
MTLLAPQSKHPGSPHFPNSVFTQRSLQSSLRLTDAVTNNGMSSRKGVAPQKCFSCSEIRLGTEIRVRNFRLKPHPSIIICFTDGDEIV